MFDISRDRADLAALSAYSFPLIPMWLGSQQKTMLLLVERALCFSKRDTTIGFSASSLFRACKLERESEKMRKREFVDVAM